ncbi:YncE family protein [Advenella sp. S44]|uniref:YncE family protein n=1 Tax=Advenella sp. S44 TaxID=1982755 RepID=UPI0013748205|nr:YncE family protein [Advenella sp. S44]
MGRINLFVWFVRCAMAGLAALCLAKAAWADRENEYVYVASQDGNSVSIVDVDTNQVVSRIQVADKPVFIAVTRDGKRGFVTHPDSGKISALDLQGKHVSAVYDFPGEPFAAVLSADEQSLFVSDWKGNAVVRISTHDGIETGRIAVGDAPAGLTLDAACQRLFVADRGSATVSVIDTGAWKHLAGIPVGASPFALASHGNQVYVANVKDNTISRLEADSLKETWRVKMQSMPYGIAISNDGKQLWVTAQQKGVLQRIGSDGSVDETLVKVGRYPEGVAIAGGRAYVATWFDDSVVVMDLEPGQVLKKIAVDAGPRIVVTRSRCKKE